MATSVVYSSIFAAVTVSIPTLATDFVAFDTAIVDLTEKLQGPVEVLFGVQLGGGTDINRARFYVRDLVVRPTQTHLILITDHFEGGIADEMLHRAAEMVQTENNVIILLALSDDGSQPMTTNQQSFLPTSAARSLLAPDQFPEMMAVALQRGDVGARA